VGKRCIKAQERGVEAGGVLAKIFFFFLGGGGGGG